MLHRIRFVAKSAELDEKTPMILQTLCFDEYFFLLRRSMWFLPLPQAESQDITNQ